MKILIVDDSKVSRMAIRKELEAGGNEIFEAVTGVDALEQIPIIKPHLITMDVHMPGLNGFETTARIRENSEKDPEKWPGHDQLPIVFITTDDTVEGRIRGFQSGATDFLTKPFSKGSLKSLVNHLLNPDLVYEGMTALLVEESPVMRKITSGILRLLGMEVITTGNGAEAFEIIKERRERLHLVCSGYHIPGMNGDELCVKTRTMLGLKDLPFIIMSSLEDEESILNVFRSGATDFIPKPFVKEIFLARINMHLEKQIANGEQRKRLEAMERFSFYQEALSRFTSEEFNSPLAEILSCADKVRSNGADADECVELAKNIRQSSQQMMALVNEMAMLNRFYADSEAVRPDGEGQGKAIHSANRS